MFDPFSSGASQLPAQILSRQQSLDSDRKSIRVAFRDNDARVGDDFGNCATRSSDNRYTARHCLDDDTTELFANSGPGLRRHNQQINLLKELGHLVVTHGPGELSPLDQIEISKP